MTEAMMAPSAKGALSGRSMAPGAPSSMGARPRARASKKPRTQATAPSAVSSGSVGTAHWETSRPSSASPILVLVFRMSIAKTSAMLAPSVAFTDVYCKGSDL